MKKFIFILFAVFLFFIFSCASTDTEEDSGLITGNDDLRHENTGTENENSELLNEIEQLQNINEALQSVYDDLLSENAQLLLENEELQTDNTGLNEGIDELLYMIEEYAAKNDELHGVNAQAVSDNDHLRDRITDLNRGIESLIDEIIQLTDSNDQLTNRAGELLADNNQLRNNVNDILNLNQNRQNENDQLRARIEALENENYELARSNDDLRSRLDELRNWFGNTPTAGSAAQSAPAETPVVISQEPPAGVLEPAPVQIMQAPPVETAADVQPPAPVNEDTETETVWPSFAPAPAVRLETLPQMGMTPLDTEIHFSRIVRATAGQILEIPFHGNGWVYLGELASRRGIAYDSRRNDNDGQSFIFSLEEPGTYILKFYRQDFIRDFILNDHVQVIVGEAPTAAAGWFNPSLDRARIIAQPRWPSALEEAQIISGARPPSEPVVTGMPQSSQTAAPSQTSPAQQTTPAAQGTAQQTTSATQGTAQQTTSAAQGTAQQTMPAAQGTAAGAPPSVLNAESYPGATTVYNPQFDNFINGLDPQNTDLIAQMPENVLRVSPNELLQSARESFDRGNVAAAIPLLDQYMEYYPGGSDESLWLSGQLYEANSPSRNILLALDYYRRLTNNYPQSSRYEDARRRIAYLERFYITIQ